MTATAEEREIIADWQPRHAALFGHERLKLNHRLRETGLFSRSALGRLIEQCPPEELGLESMCHETDKPDRIQGELGGSSGEDAIRAIEKGRMWMNVRRIMDWSPEYRALLDQVFDEFERRMPGFSTFKRNIGVLISSPNAKVYYHADIQGQSLWQIEGQKSVFLYPRSSVFMDDRNIEKILLRETDEDLPYELWYDDYADEIVLKPGEMITWPLYAPHRVQNHDCLNISVTMEHWTREIRNAYAVHYGNGVMRRTLGIKNASTRDRGLHVYPKAASALLWKRLGRQTSGDVVKQRHFRIDADAPEGLVTYA
ncbi:cupin domain-containing protein [Pararhizobium mangrovi]|uniref:JmjC domain-containing protein n=1 Tax=Pararhizobium mangrovi TaxID=2590452 RepID=A0A506TZ98_9HYPH|nr:hypothetical protein [Pararhizobium mangrovi]TPW26311.1 hypothetical protein FJU11_15280 [Pararhizobium mangrovi]